MSEKQNASDTVTVLPPSPYGICFDLKTDRFQLEEATRSGSFDMKYRHYHSTYEIYYLLEGNRYHFIDRNIFFVQPGSLVFIAKNRIHKTSPAEQHFHRRFLIEIEETVMEQWFTEMAGGRLCSLFTDEYYYTNCYTTSFLKRKARRNKTGSFPKKGSLRGND